MNYLNTVRGFIVENFLYGDDGELRDDTSFLGTGIIDSTGILEVISFLEETYGVTVDDEELIPENFDTLINIDSFLKKKMNGNGKK